MIREEAITKLKSFCHNCEKFPTCVNTDKECFKALEMAIEALSAIEQIRWERDIAIEQLNKLGYELGQKIEPCEDCVSRSDARNCITFHEVRYRMLEDFDRLPSVQPKPKTGHWEYGYAFADGNYCKCSECKEIIKCIYPMNYCPNCGAKMESEDKE